MIGETGEDMVVVVIHCNGEYFNRVLDKGRRKLITRISGSLGREMHRRTIHNFL